MKHRRRILLIDREFQLKFSFFVTSWVLVLSVVFPSILYSSIETFLRILSRKVDPTTLQGIQNFQAELVTAIVLFMIVISVTIFLIAMYVSHRVAGPVYKIKTALARWKRGNVEEEIVLRKSDHFKDLADSYNIAAKRHLEMKAEINTACEKLQKLSAELEPKHKNQVKEIIADLSCFTKKS